MPDNIGRDWLGSYGSKENLTPALDKLAATGLRFTTFWNMPSCSPSRVSLLSGRFPFRTGWTSHWDTPRSGGRFFDWRRETTFARLLKAKGYSTAVTGKWQINDLRLDKDALTKHGFDEHCVWPGFETGNPISAERYWDPYLSLNGERKIHTNRFGPDVENEFVLDFIERHRNEPFMVYYPLNLCHAPYVNTPFNRSDTTLTDAERYSGMVQYMDFLVGKVVQKLEALGLKDNTIILFTSDHSGPVGETDGRVVWPGGVGPYRDHRRAQTPLIINWPKEVSPKVSDELVSVVDVFPTLLELGDSDIPDSLQLDGYSLVPYLKGDEKHVRRKWIFSQMTREQPMRWIRNEQYLLYNDGRFYDLISDPHEKTDLTAATNRKVRKGKLKLKRILDGFPLDAKSTETPSGG